MIGVLTGVLSATEGTAKISGFDIHDDIDEVRQRIGVVPQFDILWDELTANEHMQIFAEIKGVPKELIPELTKEQLQGVKLWDVANA